MPRPSRRAVRLRCSSRRSRLLVGSALALAFRRARLPGGRKRRLRQRPHRRAHGLRRDHEPVSAGQQRRPHRPGDPVPDRLQPGLRADQHQPRGAEPDRQLGRGERPAGRVHVRPADLPGRPERPGRPRPARARGLEREPGQRDQPEPTGLLAAGRQQLPERHPVPGEQARDHPLVADRGRLDVHRAGRLHGTTGRARRRRRLDRGLVPGEHDGRAQRRASSPPSPWAPPRGCR